MKVSKRDSTTDSEEFEHVARIPLPWRQEPPTTECGLDGARFPGLSHQALLVKIKRLGKQRASLFVCVTCWNRTADHHTYSALGIASAVSWAESPSTILKREIEHETRGWGRAAQPPLIDRELHALAALVEAHREEFAELMAGLEATTDLGRARHDRAIKQARR